MKKFSLWVLAILAARAAVACDICSMYSAEDAQSGEGWYSGVFEQFSRSTTLREEGDKISNTGHARLNSFVTQAIGGYRFNDVWSLQVNVPCIYRGYERPGEDGSRERDDVQGPGDAAMLVSARVLRAERGGRLLTFRLLGGVKLPTGDSGLLREEPEAGHEEEDEEALHNHDLALGSGSCDALVGASLFGRTGRWYAQAQSQYALRTEGAHDYAFADDLTWSVQPGYTLLLSHAGTLSLGLNVNGEHKGEDKRHGVADDDTAMDAIYAGPAVSATRGEIISAELALDLPMQQENSGTQLVPDYRLRAAITCRF